MGEDINMGSNETVSWVPTIEKWLGTYIIMGVVYSISKVYNKVLENHKFINAKVKKKMFQYLFIVLL